MMILIIVAGFWKLQVTTRFTFHRSATYRYQRGLCEEYEVFAFQGWGLGQLSKQLDIWVHSAQSARYPALPPLKAKAGGPKKLMRTVSKFLIKFVLHRLAARGESLDAR